MKKSLLGLLALAGVMMFTQCKKDDGGGSPGTQQDYMPLTVGSTFTYNYDDTVRSTNRVVTYTVVKDTPAYNKTYMVLTGTDSSRIYQAKSGNTYFQLFTLAGIGSIEQQYLKDDQAQGGTWQQVATFPSPLDSTKTFTGTFDYNIVEKGTSLQVGQNTFNDVVTVRMKLVVTGSIAAGPITLPLTLDMGGGTFYYARGVGLVKSNVSIKNNSTGLPIPPNATPTLRYTQTLTAYTIK